MNLRTARAVGLAANPANRRLGWALAASAILHGVLLWPQPVPAPTAELAVPLRAILRAPPVSSAPVETAGPPASVVPRSLAPAKPQRERRPRLLAADGASKLPDVPDPLAAPVIPAVEVAAPRIEQDPAPAARKEPASHRASNSADAVPEAADGDALRQFRIDVARRVGHHDFPELADEIGAGNTSVVRVVVGPAPGTAKVAIARSSGHARLDAKARELIGAGVRTTALPEALRGREFVTEFRVEFRPRDGGPAD